jgi:hypothetical protein
MEEGAIINTDKLKAKTMGHQRLCELTIRQIAVLQGSVLLHCQLITHQEAVLGISAPYLIHRLFGYHRNIISGFF